MKQVSEILEEYSKKKISFHKREEYESFGEALILYSNKKYAASSTICSMLYEKIFTTRLVNETANPEGFIPSKDNIGEQLQNHLDREEQIINDACLSYRKITEKLVERAVLTEDQKNEYDNFYTDIRNPVAHGLTLRLFKNKFNRLPANTFEIDQKYEVIYEWASTILINKIYDIMVNKVLLKQ